MFRVEPATWRDREELMHLYALQKGQEFCFWPEDYPAAENVEEDLAQDALFVMRDCAGRFVAAVSLEWDEDKDRLRKLRKFFNRFGYEEVAADCSIAGVRDNLYVKPLKGSADLTPVIHRVLPDFYTRFMPASAVYRMLEFK